MENDWTMVGRWSRVAILVCLGLAAATAGAQMAPGEPTGSASIHAVAPESAEPAAPASAGEGTPGPKPTTSAIVDRSITTLRLGIVIATFFLLRGRRRRQGQLVGLTPRQRKIALGTLATVSVLANYNFFTWIQTPGFHAHEVFHYYMGAKYFPELGYFDLYECSAAAVVESHPGLSPKSFKVRDLRTHRHRPASQVMPKGPRCDGAFSAERWTQFRTDIEWFAIKLNSRRFFRALRDYGYNPSPVWTLVGRPIAEVVPADQLPIVLLARIDLALMAFAFFVVWRVFGVEGLCLAAIAWGANPLSRYQWVGDAFLRYGWLAATIVGIACLKARRFRSAGSLLALASLLRLFPALFVVAYGAWALRSWIREGRPSNDLRDFAIGAAATATVLLAVAPVVSGRGLSVYGEFAENMRTYSQESYWNSVGLRPLLSFTTEAPEPLPRDGGEIITEDARKAQRLQVFEARRPLYLAFVLGTLALLWVSAGRCRDWEAATLGFPLIVVLTAPPTYYMSAVVPLALLATARERLALALMAALAGWCVLSISTKQTTSDFVAASVIAIALGLYALIEARRSAESLPEPGASETGH